MATGKLTLDIISNMLTHDDTAKLFETQLGRIHIFSIGEERIGIIARDKDTAIDLLVKKISKPDQDGDSHKVWEIIVNVLIDMLRYGRITSEIDATHIDVVRTKLMYGPIATDLYAAVRPGLYIHKLAMTDPLFMEYFNEMIRGVFAGTIFHPAIDEMNIRSFRVSDIIVI